MENNFDIEDNQASTCPGRKSHFLLWYCFIGLALLISAFVIFSIFFSVSQKSADRHIITQMNESKKNTTVSEVPPFSSSLESSYSQFTFQDLFSGKQLLKDSYDYTWLADGSFCYVKQDDLKSASGIYKIPPNSFHPQLYLDSFEQLKRLSSDQQYTLSSRPVFRQPSNRFYVIVKMFHGSKSSKTWSVGKEENVSIQAFYWNPKNNSHDFIFVQNYNLYYQQDPENRETIVQLTSQGTILERFGISNWLYDEEIFEGRSSLSWSFSGRYVSYLKFDDRLVNRILLPSYSEDEQYTKYAELPYPKAGVEHNTRVTQFIWDIETQKVVETAPPNQLISKNESFYIFRNVWIDLPLNVGTLGKERLVTVWSNRNQNEIYFSLCNELDCIMAFSQPMKIGNRSLWAEPQEVGCIHQTTNGFLTILPHNYNNNIYNHVAHVELDSVGAGKITQWIGQDFDIVSIVGYSPQKNVLFVNAYGREIGEMTTYVITEALYDGEREMKKVVDDCVNTAVSSIDPTGGRLMLQCQEPFKNTRLYLLDTDNITNGVRLDGDMDVHLPFDQPGVKYGKFKLSSGIDGHYMLMTPPSVGIGKKLPLLVDLYGGPNSKRVLKKTPSAHLIQICSQHETVIMNVDVGGTAGRGWNVKEPIYKRLGQMETQDTLEMIQQILNENSFIDEDKIAVMGWSYGGFLATKIALKDQGDLVRCAIAISPVTNFKYYDTAYTERYLGQPAENMKGFESTNLIPHAKNLTNVKYFLAHGEKDDNVHYQNTALWSEALQVQGLHFTHLTYANEAHDLIGKIQHLYQEIDIFLVYECFNHEH